MRILVASTVLILAQTAPVLEEQARLNPHNGALWKRLGEERPESGNFNGAIAAYQRALELGFLPAAEGWGEIAAVHARAGRPQDVFSALERAVELGYRFRGSPDRDKRFASMASDSRMARIIGATRIADPQSSGAWQADLDFLLREIRRLHPLFRSGRPPAEFEAVRESIARRLTVLSDAEVTVQLQRLLASIGDGQEHRWRREPRQG